MKTQKIKNVSASGRVRLPGLGYVEPGQVIEVTVETAACLIAGGNFIPVGDQKGQQEQEEE